MAKHRCDYTVVRWVPDPLREEAKNLGVILVCEDLNFVDTRFQVPAYLKSAPERAAILDAIVARYAVPDWSKGELEALHRESSGVLQFRAVASALADDPSALLADLYRQFIFKPGRSSGIITTGVVQREIAKELKQQHANATVRDRAPLVVPELGSITFDLGIYNGSLRHVLEVVSLSKSVVAAAEHTGAWFAHVWPAVRVTTAATPFLLVQPGHSPEARVVADRLDVWTASAGIELVQASKPAEIRAFARQLLPSYA